MKKGEIGKETQKTEEAKGNIREKNMYLKFSAYLFQSTVTKTAVDVDTWGFCVYWYKLQWILVGFGGFFWRLFDQVDLCLTNQY